MYSYQIGNIIILQNENWFEIAGALIKVRTNQVW